MADEKEKKRKPGAEPGNVRAVRHGVFSFLARGSFPPCDKCLFASECDLYLKDSHCRLFENIEREETENIMALDHIRPEHRPVVQLYVRNHVLCRIIDLWCSKVSPFRGTGRRRSLDTQGVMKMRWVAENAATRQAELLGLTPASRERLGLPRDTGKATTIRVGGTQKEYIDALRKARDYVEPEDSPRGVLLMLPPARNEESKDDH